MLMTNNPQQFQQGHQRQTTTPVQQQVNQQVRPVSQQFNLQFNQYTPPHASPLLSQPPFNPQYPPSYPGQWPQHPSSVHSNITETSELITQVLDRQFKLYQGREDANKKHERWREERQKKFKDDNNGNRINKAFKKKPDSMDPTQTSAYHGWRRSCPWPITTKGMQEKNCSTTVVEAFRRPCIPCPLKPRRTKFMIYCCKITPISKLCLSAYLLSNLSNKNLKSRYRHTMQDTSHSMSWHMKALPLKVMGPRLAASIMPTLYMGSLVTRWMGGRILTKQCIHTRKVNEVNHTDVSSDYQEFEVNEAEHVQNPNYKGKNYDPNYQKNKNNYNSNLNSSYNNKNSSNNGNNFTNGNFRKNNKDDYTEIPSNIEVTLKGPVNQDQLAKINEILKNPRIYKDKLPKNQYPASGEYAKSFNKFCSKKVEINEATVVDVICYGMHLKKSPKMAEAIDIYKALSDDTYYGPKEQATDPSQEDQ